MTSDLRSKLEEIIQRGGYVKDTVDAIAKLFLESLPKEVKTSEEDLMLSDLGRSDSAPFDSGFNVAIEQMRETWKI